MNEKEFSEKFEKNFWKITPVSWQLKDIFHDNWLRIHSLPNAKRYAQNTSDWEILLKRQNTIFEELLGEDSCIFAIIQEEKKKSQNWKNFFPDSEIIYWKNYMFKDEETGENMWELHFSFAKIFWKNGRFDDIFKEIADDNARVIFVDFSKKILVAPYDWGIDIIFPDTNSRKIFHEKYKEWTSERTDWL